MEVDLEGQKYSLGRLTKDQIIVVILNSPILTLVEDKLGSDWFCDDLGPALKIYKDWLRSH
ncbi:hypothetical protein RED65_01858 [Oceanobacter sp. RED65]|uniref:Uncharacterized protein n=1 Tax=Bermanella marisrubri TaxID=207949 RepID=Q1MXJ0_9GAMM|nr:hypothetical protein RED65_01858 [Oceanobacter sp. RED65] [Bermanella marisrubri]